MLIRKKINENIFVSLLLLLLFFLVKENRNSEINTIQVVFSSIWIRANISLILFSVCMIEILRFVCGKLFDFIVKEMRKK